MFYWIDSALSKQFYGRGTEPTSFLILLFVICATYTLLKTLSIASVVLGLIFIKLIFMN